MFHWSIVVWSTVHLLDRGLNDDRPTKECCGARGSTIGNSKSGINWINASNEKCAKFFIFFWRTATNDVCMDDCFVINCVCRQWFGGWFEW